MAPGWEACWGCFLVFFHMKVYCVFSLESPHRGCTCCSSLNYHTFRKNIKMTNFVFVVIEKTPITCFLNVQDFIYKDK